MQNCVHVTVKKKKKSISAHKGKGTKAAGEIKHMHQVFTLDIKRRISSLFIFVVVYV